MRPISDEWLNSRLTSGSKRRLKSFRSSLSRDVDRRNYDKRLVDLMEEYVLPHMKSYYKDVKHYLRDLRSSKDGKLFSQGVKEYAQMEQAIQRFLEPNHPSFQWNKNYQSAKEWLIREFSNKHLHIMYYDDDESIINAFPKLNTHCGFEYLMSGRKKKGENLEGIYNRYLEEERKARNDGSFNKPILPGYRTQASGAFGDNDEFTYDCKHKTRLVSMIDMFQIIAELRFAMPFQKELAKNVMYAGGKSSQEISTIITGMRNKYSYFISLDYSAFDQSISDWLIHDVFDIMKYAFSFFDDELYEIIKYDFICKNFIMSDGVYYAKKGVPSGSMFTQIVDSIANLLMVKTYLNSCGNEGAMIVMGDDNLLYSREQILPEIISSYITKNFGVKVNAEKTKYGNHIQDPEFLSRVWSYNGQSRSNPVVISKMLYPERYRNYQNGLVDEKLVFYAYMLTYPITMWRLFDVHRFSRDNPNLEKSIVEDLVDSRYIPGALAYIREYTAA